MGPRKAGEADPSPAPSTEPKGSIVRLPASLLTIEGDDGDATPEPGDEVEITGTVEKVDGETVSIRVAEAIVDEAPEDEETAPEMSEEDRLREMAREADEEA
jgi:hypothetical protein